MSHASRLAVAGAVCAALIGVAAYWSSRPSCLTDAHATTGDIRMGPDGTLMRFDGRCWAANLAPRANMRDMPF